MLEKKELSSLLIQLISIKLILSYPRRIILESGNAAWIQIILNTLTVLFIFWLTLKFYERKKNIIDISSKRLGKAGRIITGLLIFISLLINFISVVQIFPESVKIALLQNIDTRIIIIMFGISTFFGALFGIEANAKISYIFLPIAGVIMIIFLILLFPHYKFNNIMPILGNGVKSILKGSIKSLSVFEDIIVLYILISYSKNLEDVRKSGYKAIIISGIIGLLIMVSYSLIYPYPVSKDFIMPIYQLTKIIHLGNYFNRFEAIFEFLWAIIILLYGAAYMFIMCYIWKVIFNLKHIKPLFLPMTLLVTALALKPDSLITVIEYPNWLEYAILPIIFLLPLIIALITRKSEIK